MNISASFKMYFGYLNAMSTRVGDKNIYNHGKPGGGIFDESNFLEQGRLQDNHQRRHNLQGFPRSPGF